MLEKQRQTEVPLASVPPLKCIAGGSSDTHNNHNNGISRVTRGPPPRIVPPNVPPLLPLLCWLHTRRENRHGGLSSLDSTAVPLRSQTADRQGSGPSFRGELQPRNVHDHAAKQGQHEGKSGSPAFSETPNPQQDLDCRSQCRSWKEDKFYSELEEKLELKDSRRRLSWRLLRKHRISRRAAE